MMNSVRHLIQQNGYQLRHFHKCVTRRTNAAAAAVKEPLTIPPSSTEEKPVSQKIDKIANEITALNLIEVAELSELLKKRLNLPDAPVMPMGGFMAAPKVEEEEAEKETMTQSSFTVKLLKFDDKQKIALIKELKSLIPDTNLVQAKKIVESAPVILKADLSKQEAEALKDAILKVGGEVEIC